MKNIVLTILIFMCATLPVTAAPLVQKVINDTDFGLLIKVHTDTSKCSLQDKDVVIYPHTVLNSEFLLEVGYPSLVFRPVFYQDPQTKEIAWMTNKNNYDYESNLVDQAYQLWKKYKHTLKYKNNAQSWLKSWVGYDLKVVPHQVELLGYLVNLSRVAIVNERHQHVQWLSFSKGIFSKLVLELHVVQHPKKGFIGKIHILHGEGGICTDGVIERL